MLTRRSCVRVWRICGTSVEHMMRFPLTGFNITSSLILTTRHRMLCFVTQVSMLLAPGGRVSIFENMYDGVVVDQLPSYLIYHLTSLKSISPLTRFLGANTGGTGVCFLSKTQLDGIFQRAGWVFFLTDDEKLKIHQLLRFSFTSAHISFLF